MNQERQPYGTSFGILRRIYQENLPSTEGVLANLGITSEDFDYKHKRAVVSSPAVRAHIDRLNSESILLEQLGSLKDKSGRDSLTGLLNREKFDEEFKRAAKQAKYEGSSLSVVVLDINGLKETNDKYGHTKGDELISNTGKVLTSNTRRIDGKSVEAGRLGNKGDEFHVFLRNASRTDALAWWERANSDFQDWGISIAAGISEVDLSENPQIAIEKADERMYLAKELSKILGVNIGIAEDIDLGDPNISDLKPATIPSDIQNISDFPILISSVPNFPVLVRDHAAQLIS